MFADSQFLSLFTFHARANKSLCEQLHSIWPTHLVVDLEAGATGAVTAVAGETVAVVAVAVAADAAVAVPRRRSGSR